MWHGPRGMTAGYKPALHTLMQALGAEGLKALPQEGPDGKAAPLTTKPEVRRLTPDPDGLLLLLVDTPKAGKCVQSVSGCTQRLCGLGWALVLAD